MNDKQRYQMNMEKLRRHPYLCRALFAGNKLLTLLGYLSYPALLYFSYFKSLALLCFLIFLPGLFFLLFSFYRKKKNAPRPYELYQCPPLIPKNTCGNSFPSRHVFSLSMIAILWMSHSLLIGVLLLLLSTLLGIFRVAGGVHFIKDIVWGLLCGIAGGTATLLLFYVFYTLI